jgi:hypothetical protein
MSDGLVKNVEPTQIRRIPLQKKKIIIFQSLITTP